MIKKGVYAASLTILNEDKTLNIDLTIDHAVKAIKSGLHGVFFFGSTGQSQLISVNEKKEFISKIANHKMRKQFFLGTGNNSLIENIDLIKYAMEYDFKDFLIMPPAYYKYRDEDVINYFSRIIKEVDDCKIILYNFEKLCGYKFSKNCVEELVKKFPRQIVGIKDSSYNLFETLKIKNFLIFPGSEGKLLKGLEIGCSGIITATCNVTSRLARKVYDDFHQGNNQTANEKLCKVREVFEQYNLISALHTVMSKKDKIYENILPILSLLSENDKKKLFEELEKLDFNIKN